MCLSGGDDWIFNSVKTHFLKLSSETMIHFKDTETKTLHVISEMMDFRVKSAV